MARTTGTPPASRPSVRRDGAEAGAVAAEYVAAVVIIAAVVAALLMLALPERVGETGEAAVDCLFEHDDCELPPLADDEPQGPPAPPADRHVEDARSGDERREGDDPTGQDDLDDTYDAIGDWHDYLWRTFGRDSTDGEGAPLVAIINDPSIANAEWSRGDQRSSYRPGWATDSWIHHEFAHGLVQSLTGGLDTSDPQTHALNEGLADIFSMNVTGVPSVGHDQAHGRPNRAFDDPSSTGNPDHVRDYDDSAGGHFNSTIVSHAYYLLTEDVGQDVSEQLVYRALEEHLDTDAGLDDFRTAMLAAADDLHGPDSDERAAVEDAFDAVGLDGTWTGP